MQARHNSTAASKVRCLPTSTCQWAGKAPARGCTVRVATSQPLELTIWDLPMNATSDSVKDSLADVGIMEPQTVCMANKRATLVYVDPWTDDHKLPLDQRPGVQHDRGHHNNVPHIFCMAWWSASLTAMAVREALAEKGISETRVHWMLKCRLGSGIAGTVLYTRDHEVRDTLGAPFKPWKWGSPTDEESASSERNPRAAPSRSISSKDQRCQYGPYRK